MNRSPDPHRRRSHEPTVTARRVRPLAGHLLTLGVDLPRFLAEVGLELDGVFAPTGRIPASVNVALWRLAAALTGDRQLGLHALESFNFNALSAVSFESEYIVIQSFAVGPTVGEGLARIARLFPVACDRERLLAEPRANGGMVVRHVFSREEASCEPYVEYAVGMIVRAVCQLGVVRVAPPEVRFAHAPPKELAAYERVLGAPARFGAGENAWYLAPAQLAIPLSTANPALARLLEQRAKDLLATVPPAGAFLDRIRAVLSAELPRSDVTAVHVARRLGMSLRTFTRRLGEIGTTHQALVDEVRSTLAAGYVADGELTLEDVATRLGFVEVSSLQRAFKRWFGVTPAEYRRGFPRADARPGRNGGGKQ